MREIIQIYFKSWLDKDVSKLTDIFSENIVYSECYGPEYIGINQVKEWFIQWNKNGDVTRWDIKNTIEKDNILIVEWYFECDYEGKSDGFDGVTIAKFNENKKIYDLKEFQSKAEHYRPYEE